MNEYAQSTILLPFFLIFELHKNCAGISKYACNDMFH